MSHSSFFKNISIRQKLIWFSMVTALITLLLTCVAFVTYDLIRFRSDTTKKVLSIADIIGMNSAAPLLFDDPEAGKEILNALKKDKNILAASLYTKEGEVFASYVRRGNYVVFPNKPKKDGKYFDSNYLTVFQPIEYSGERIGTSYVQGDLSEFYNRLKEYLLIVGGVFILCLLITYFLSKKLRHLISKPIIHLTEVANRVSTTENYSIRAVKETGDESGVLVDRFNEMLSQIEYRDEALQKAYDELHRAQRLESLGILAGGVAHDFNNLLTAIVTNIEYGKSIVDSNEEIYEILGDVEIATNQGMDITQQFLTFAKGGDPIKKLTKISDLIKNSAEFSLRGSSVKCEYDIDENLWLVSVDEGQLNQVISNLFINAKQAMINGGSIWLSAENVVLNCESNIPLVEGNYVKITVRDNGVGIADDALDKIFDPYFSTKDEGSGLGLSTSYSIIKKHNGHIGVESKIGKGTKFYFYLPASDEEYKKTERSQKGMENEIAGKRKILVMDDEELIRKIVEKQLNRIGYEVVLASDGLEAAEIYSEAMNNNQPFDIVIVDLTVPGGVGGKELIERLVEIDPDVKAVVVSGYSEDPVMAEYEKYNFKGCVKKPFDIKELTEVIETVLSS